MSENEKSLVQRFWNGVWNEGKIELVDELVASDFVAHDLPPEMAHGPEGYKEYVRANRAAFPDGQDVIQDIIAEDDKVVVRYIGRATHRGDLMGFKATGKRVEVPGVEIFRVVSGRIKETWSLWDTFGFLEQIGAISLPES
ncbi:MAG TPA: ester cyclase [Anaerolineae bacterium]|nr:ester cyclase [Anaerolineae bacterium]